MDMEWMVDFLGTRIGAEEDLVLNSAFKITVVKLEFLKLKTSRPVWKSGKFSKSGPSGNRTFSIPYAGLLEIEKKIQKPQP